MGAEILAELHYRTLLAYLLPGHWFRFVLVDQRLTKLADVRLAYRQYLVYLNKKLDKGEVEAFKTDEKALAMSAE